MSEQKKQNTASDNQSVKKSYYDMDVPEKLHCRRCKTLMENGVCPTCGFKMYVPMSVEKQNKIKLIGTIITMVIFVALFVVLQIAK